MRGRSSEDERMSGRQHGSKQCDIQNTKVCKVLLWCVFGVVSRRQTRLSVRFLASYYGHLSSFYLLIFFHSIPWIHYQSIGIWLCCVYRRPHNTTRLTSSSQFHVSSQHLISCHLHMIYSEKPWKPIWNRMNWRASAAASSLSVFDSDDTAICITP